MIKKITLALIAAMASEQANSLKLMSALKQFEHDLEQQLEVTVHNLAKKGPNAAHDIEKGLSGLISGFKGSVDTSMQVIDRLHQCHIAHDAPLWNVFDETLKDTGYSYESYETTTEDNYILTLVRLIKEDEDAVVRAKRTPVLFQHGIAMNSESWIDKRNKEQNPIILQTMDAGYDVWLTNNRGTRYSIDHKELDAKKQPEYWNYSWEQEGKYDGPANIKKVLEVTGYQKLAFVGYSLGTMQMFYGLAKDQDEFFKNNVSIFVALAPCTKISHSFFNPAGLGQMVQDMMYNKMNNEISHLDVKAMYGPNWEQDKETICQREGFLVCEAIKDICIGQGQAFPLRTIQHGYQNIMKDQFAEFDPEFTQVKHLKASKARTKQVPLQNIEGTPIHMFVGKDDGVCSPQDATWTKNMMTGLTPNQLSYTQVEGNHYTFVSEGDQSYFSKVLDVLQKPEYKPTKLKFVEKIQLYHAHDKSRFYIVLLLLCLIGLALAYMQKNKLALESVKAVKYMQLTNLVQKKK